MNPVDLLTSPAGARLWRDLVDGIPAGLFVINLDGRDRTVSNASLSRLIGYEPEECLLSLLEFFRARLLPGEELRLRQRVRELTAMAPGQPAEVDVWFFHRDDHPGAATTMRLHVVFAEALAGGDEAVVGRASDALIDDLAAFARRTVGVT